MVEKKSNLIIFSTISVIFRTNPFFRTNSVIFRRNKLILEITWDQNLDCNRQKLTKTDKNGQKLREINRIG